jgi:hypothetical protein
MKNLHEAHLVNFCWRQPKPLKRSYELTNGVETLATLVWEKSLGSLARAETASGVWTFKRAGFVAPRVTVRLADSEKDIAIFQPNWTGAGTLELQTGDRFRWQSSGFWNPTWSFADSTFIPIVSFKADNALWKENAKVEFGTKAQQCPSLPILLCLGWYLMLLYSEDVSSTLIITSSLLTVAIV